MAKTLTEMAAEIVAAQASHAVMASEEMVVALRKTFEALKNIKTIEDGGPEGETPPVDPKKSIQRNYIVNLEDGKKYKQLTARTLAKFGLTPAEYRKKPLHSLLPGMEQLCQQDDEIQRRDTAGLHCFSHHALHGAEHSSGVPAPGDSARGCRDHAPCLRQAFRDG